MNTPNNSRLDRFLALDWYERILRFVVTFVAKTSELLLAAGLVVSTANFLTDGNVLNNAQAAAAWAWVQALALDSSLGISFYYTLQCLKQRDWVKFALYTILTGLLTLVAGSITNVDIFSHAIHTTMSNALARLGFDVGLLSTLRAIAVVGFVLLSRLKDVSLKDLYTSGEAEPPGKSATRRNTQAPTIDRTQTSEFSHLDLRVEEVALLIQTLTQRSSDAGILRSLETMQTPLIPPAADTQQRSEAHPAPADPAPTQVEGTGVPAPAAPAAVPEPEGQPSPEPAPQRRTLRDKEPPPGLQQDALLEAGPVAVQRVEPGNGKAGEREERLECAYQSLLAEGSKISARALAQRAHVHRTTCHDWLEAREQQKGESA